MLLNVLGIRIQDLANWFTIVALPFTVIGLIMTYLQGKKVKKAADAANEAALATARKIDSLESIDNLARHIEKLQSCSTLLTHKEYSQVIHILNEANAKLFIEIEVKRVDVGKTFDLKKLHSQICDDITDLRERLREENDEIRISVIESHIDHLIKIFSLISSKIKNKQK